MGTPGSALVGDHGGALAAVFEWTHTLRYVLLALNCAMVLVFMGVMRNGAKQFARYEERAKKYGTQPCRNVLFVIAHPDDEAMFFVPSILSLGEFEGYCLHVLCLSSGNFLRLRHGLNFLRFRNGQTRFLCGLRFRQPSIVPGI